MRTTIARLAAIHVLLGSGGSACTVPVFRYALDRWPADAYRLEAPEGWVESPAGRELQRALEDSRTPLEIDSPETGVDEARLVMPGENAAVVWSGDPDDAAADQFTSPAREEVARRILDGESMVWVMVATGDESKDEAFENRLKERLAYLGDVAAIPEQDPYDPESRLGPGPELRVGFSLLKVERGNPDEEVFLKMLAGPDGRRLLEGDEPYAGAVFGRGRVLGAWPASALDDTGIDEVSLFLLGACSCKVKYENPGWDLAMAVDWETRLMAAQMEAERGGSEEDESPEAAEEPAELPARPEVVSFEGEVDEEGADAEPAGAGTLVLIAVVAGALALLIGTILFLRRSH